MGLGSKLVDGSRTISTRVADTAVGASQSILDGTEKVRSVVVVICFTVRGGGALRGCMKPLPNVGRISWCEHWERLMAKLLEF